MCYEHIRRLAEGVKLALETIFELSPKAFPEPLLHLLDLGFERLSGDVFEIVG